MQWPLSRQNLEQGCRRVVVRPSGQEIDPRPAAALAARQLIVVRMTARREQCAGGRHNGRRPENDHPVYSIPQLSGQVQNSAELAALALPFIMLQAPLWPDNRRILAIDGRGKHRFSRTIKLNGNRQQLSPAYAALEVKRRSEVQVDRLQLGLKTYSAHGWRSGA
jgi:hypothetical protein